jgi:hypothetical protein
LRARRAFWHRLAAQEAEQTVIPLVGRLDALRRRQYDGHVKSKKWLATLYPMNQNNWELSPNPDPNNRRINGPSGCDSGDRTGHLDAPSGPNAKEFQTRECMTYQ